MAELQQEIQRVPTGNDSRAGVTTSVESHDQKLLRLLNSSDNIGGFKLLKGLVKGLENLDPKRRAMRNIFLTEDTYKSERKRLEREISEWIDILSADRTAEESKDYCQEEISLVEESLTSNLMQIRETVRSLEITYTALKSFFDNAKENGEEIRHLSLINVDRSRLNDMDSDDSKSIISELEKNYDKLSLQESYNLLVMPRYLGPSVVIRDWAKQAHKNKVLIVTDFEDCYDFNDLIYKLRKANMQDSDIELSNVIMACNYIIGRKKSELAGEDDDLYIPVSAAIAGRMSDVDNVMISQGIAGVKFGALNKVLGTRFEMRKSEISLLIDNGVIPVVEENGRTMAFSNQSLYRGDRFGLQEYPVVRVLDWVGKVIQNYCNGWAFNTWGYAERNEVQQSLIDFLNECKVCHLFEKYNLKEVKQDPTTLNIIIRLEILPNLAAKNFLIELAGQKEDNYMSWNQTF